MEDVFLDMAEIDATFAGAFTPDYTEQGDYFGLKDESAVRVTGDFSAADLSHRWDTGIQYLGDFTGQSSLDMAVPLGAGDSHAFFTVMSDQGFDGVGDVGAEPGAYRLRLSLASGRNVSRFAGLDPQEIQAIAFGIDNIQEVIAEGRLVTSMAATPRRASTAPNLTVPTATPSA